MLTNDQLIYVIRAIYPQITVDDHGRQYWVGMPVSGDTQLDDAFIAHWGFTGLTEPTKAEIDAKWADATVQAAYADSMKPLPKTVFSSLEYLSKFTDAEYQAARTGPMAIQRGLDMLIAAQFVDIVNDPRVADYLAAMVSAGIITDARKTELLTPQAA